MHSQSNDVTNKCLGRQASPFANHGHTLRHTTMASDSDAGSVGGGPGRNMSPRSVASDDDGDLFDMVTSVDDADAEDAREEGRVRGRAMGLDEGGELG